MIRNLLLRVKELILSGYVPNPYAVTQSGLSIDSLNPSAKRFSFCGALLKAQSEISCDQVRLYELLSDNGRIVCLDHWAREQPNITYIVNRLDELIEKSENGA